MKVCLRYRKTRLDDKEVEIIKDFISFLQSQLPLQSQVTVNLVPSTIVSYEYPMNYDGFNEPYYPVRDEINTKIYFMYESLAKKENKFIFGGRLATYVYYDMHQVIAQALKLSNELLSV